MKDSVIIKDGMFYFGRLNSTEHVLDSQLNHSKLNKIDGSRIKTIQINSRKRSITITYNKDDQAILRLDKEFNISSFENEILDSFKRARVLNDYKTKLYLIKKPLISIAVLFCLILIISFTYPDSNLNSHNGSRLSTEAVSNLLNGFASLGMPKVLLIFGTLMLIPLLSIFLKLRNRKGKSIIKF
tara:strand:+ start:1608 stop:2162 length:555 start_codon:yes stop_codon:yes gene_type:complete